MKKRPRTLVGAVTRAALCLAALCLPIAAAASGRPELESGTVTFKASDGVIVTGDLYIASGADAPFIILYHMAGSSRGEYAEIAPRLGRLGFNCLAVDQRSGGYSNGLENLTAKDARERKKGSSYVDAYPDAEAALLWAARSFEPETMLLWGSSYSADLVIILAAKHPDLVDGALSFSPGEYFRFQGIPLAEYAKSVNVPMFVTASRSEAGRSRPYFDAIPGAGKVFFLPTGGNGDHGTPALFESCKTAPEYWAAVEAFLTPFADR